MYKLMYGGCVTVTTGCILNFVLEHVAEFTVVRKLLIGRRCYRQHSKAVFLSINQG